MRSRRFFNDLAEELRELPKEIRIIAIDGRCAAGKTTLADRLVKELGGDVIHMDDFFLPPALRTEARRDEAGGNVHYERFLSEVAPSLRTHTALTYRRFDCASMDYDPVPRTIPQAALTIVEGSYSLHPALRHLYTDSLFLTISPVLQRSRLLARCPERFDRFQSLWIPLEERYIAVCAPDHACGFVLTAEDCL